MPAFVVVQSSWNILGVADVISPRLLALQDIAIKHGHLVGPARFELATSPLSGVRSNQLSYEPGTKIVAHGAFEAF
jgi:hypothetical protein